MDRFGIERDVGGSGSGSYAHGLITLDDGSARGVESVVRVTVREDAASGVIGRTAAVAGSFRDALGLANAASLPVRLAVSTLRAGLGAIEEGFRGSGRVDVEIGFADGTDIAARMPPETAALIRRDAEIARAAVERAGLGVPAAVAPAVVLPAADTGPDEALTSIFRYEKRHGRLRRVAGSGTPEA